MKTGAFIFGAIFLVVGLGMVYGGYIVFQDTQELQGMEPVQTGEIDGSMGEIIVEGEARQSETGMVQTRFENEEAIAYEWEIEEKEVVMRGDSTRTEWDTAESGEEAVDFYVEDSSGRVYVDTDEVDVDVDTGIVERNGDRRRLEGAIQPGDEILVRGYATTGDDGAHIASDDGESVTVREGDKEDAVREGYMIVGILGIMGLLFSTVGGLISASALGYDVRKSSDPESEPGSKEGGS